MNFIEFTEGESDNESLVTPHVYSQTVMDQEYNEERQWEIERLRQIQADEAQMIGYSFEDDDEEFAPTNQMEYPSEEVSSHLL